MCARGPGKSVLLPHHPKLGLFVFDKITEFVRVDVTKKLFGGSGSVLIVNSSKKNGWFLFRQPMQDKYKNFQYY